MSDSICRLGSKMSHFSSPTIFAARSTSHCSFFAGARLLLMLAKSAPTGRIKHVNIQSWLLGMHSDFIAMSFFAELAGHGVPPISNYLQMVCC